MLKAVNAMLGGQQQSSDLNAKQVPANRTPVSEDVTTQPVEKCGLRIDKGTTPNA
jgi:hypothetical protein